MKSKYFRLILLILFACLLPFATNAKESNGNKLLVSNLKFKTLNTGQGLCPGSAYEIEWQGINASDTVVIYYSTNAGTNWILVTDTATGLKYFWNVPNTPSPSCIARITEKHPDCSSRQSYSNVTIGNQVWMGENLDVCTYRNGDPIPEVTDPTQWSTLTTGAWCYYNNDPAMGAIYGKLYNWFAVNDPRGLAPVGWHIPSDGDWSKLDAFLGPAVAGGKLKSTGTKENGDGLWLSPNTGATNESGFTALPAGDKQITNGFTDLNSLTYWWSSKEWQSDNTAVWVYSVSYGSGYSGSGGHSKKYGFSVRCIKDNLPPIIDSISPSKAFVGEDLILYGSNFGATQVTSKVSFTGADAVQYSSWTDSQIKVKVPVGATTGKVSVIVNGTKSNEVDYMLLLSDTLCTQKYSKRNLDVDHYRNGDPIPEVTDPTQWSNLTTGAWCYYNNDPALGVIYGKLYNWFAINDPRGLAPEGWHVPSDSEWTDLQSCLGGVSLAGGRMKETGFSHWTAPNTDATNSSGFSGLPGGYRSNGNFYNIQNDAAWWSSSEYNAGNALSADIHFNLASMGRSGVSKNNGFSVRCLVDDTTNQTPNIDSISPSKAFVGEDVILYGSNFRSTQGISKVSFTGSDASQYSNWSNSEIKVRVPVGATTGKVSISVNGTKSNEVDFTLADCNGRKSYSNVTIGNQIWMGENLDVCTYQNGDPIPQVSDSNQWASLKTGAWCYYKYDSSNGLVYGKLYNWYAVADPRGLAPLGWHIPSNNEWIDLENFFGDSLAAGGKLKESGTKHWMSPNLGASNESGFTALPGGFCSNDCKFDHMGNYGHWWTSSEQDLYNAYYRDLGFDNSVVYKNFRLKNLGFSVRCINDTFIPKIDSISPIKAFTGEDIILYGSNFGSTQGTSKVSFNSVDAVIYSNWSNSQIQVKVPVGATTGKVSVTVNGTKSNLVDFNLIDDRVKICTQIWMVKNLNVDHYRNGDLIPEVTDPTQWSKLTTGAWCYYNNDPAMGAIYGKLYNWYAVNDPRGLAPVGWHIPSDTEWVELEVCLGDSAYAGGKLKSTGTKEGGDGLWLSPNTDATNESGFNALPGGYQYKAGSFYSVQFEGYWWSTTPYLSAYAWSRTLFCNKSNIKVFANEKVEGYSVRCVKD